jgi:glyoxylase-like metal-dependent hydrolase (beta-lactamase superfamily II)
VEFAALKGTTITRVIDTLMQADHRSGGRELAARTGAAYYLHEAADVAFAFSPLADGAGVDLRERGHPSPPHA